MDTRGCKGTRRVTKPATLNVHCKRGFIWKEKSEGRSKLSFGKSLRITTLIFLSFFSFLSLH